MRGSELAEAMAVAVDRLMSARKGTGTLGRAVGTIGRFEGKDGTSYLKAYRAEMIMRDIPEDRRFSDVLEVLARCQSWEEFEGRLLGRSSKGLTTRFVSK